MRYKKINIPSFARVAAVLLFFSCGFFLRCANISGSIGGGPKDTLPPILLRANPANGSTDIWPNKIYIQFNEMVQLKNLQKEFFTSPFMAKKPLVTTKRQGIEVVIESDLDSNTTYVLNFGGSVVDNNENNPFIGLEYVFSTGSYIDSVYMSGYTQDAATLDTMGGAFILFFDPKDDTDPEYDSTVFNNLPLAVGYSRPNGVFIHSNLKATDYKIYALLDNNSNQIYDPGTDAIAFMDTLFNPANMPSFHMWYDSTVMYYVAEPQLLFRMFSEEPSSMRQNLSSFSRPELNRIILSFASPDPVIEDLTFEGISFDSIIVEQVEPTCDSTIYWIRGLPAEMPDTVSGSITYLRPDSLGHFVPHTQELKLIYKKPELSRREQRAQEKEEAEAEGKPKKKNWFQRWRERRRQKKIAKALKVLGKIDDISMVFAIDSTGAIVTDSLGMALVDSLESAPQANADGKASAMRISWDVGNPVTPYGGKRLKLELPAVYFDMDSIVMTHTDIREVVTESPVTLTQDTLHIREYVIGGTYTDSEKYEIMIPAGAIQTIDGEVNDTVRYTITIADKSKFATLQLNLTGDGSAYDYIVQIMDGGGKNVQQELTGMKPGVHEINYVTVGKISVRIVEDRNGNGKWDTGDLIRRLQPEKVAFYEDPMTGSREITTTISIDRELNIDLDALFSDYVLKSAFDRYHMHDHENENDHDHDHGNESGTDSELPAGEAVMPREAEINENE